MENPLNQPELVNQPEFVNQLEFALKHRSECYIARTVNPPSIPYRIAVLCYLFDDAGRLLLLHRVKPPNNDLYSPVGGKLEQDTGESPTMCAIREIKEETGIKVAHTDLHLTGIVSEEGFQAGDESMHWLMFLFEVTRPVKIRGNRSNGEAHTFDEGTLEWHERRAIDNLPIPETDRQIIWPLFWKHRGGFFTAHVDCTGDSLQWRVETSRPKER